MSFHNPFDLYSDSRLHAAPGPSRNARLQKVTLPGGGFIAKGEDGRLAVAGRESLRILRVLEAPQSTHIDPKHPSRPAFRIESTKNLWEGSNLKVDCSSTDVAWAYGVYNNKILTSARNGELIMWDLAAKSGHSKYERKTKEHLRSIHAMTVSHVVHHYCVTGSADGDFRIWDLRDIKSSVMRVHNPSAVRRLAFSPCVWNPLFILVGMDNGTLHRWDLKMGQRGLLDRLPVAHTAPITTMDWYSGSEESPHAIAISNPYLSDDYTSNTLGWVATAGMDHCVKIWNLTGSDATTRMPTRPTYTLHTSYPIRRVLWRPGYECELAVVSQADFTTTASATSPPPSAVSMSPRHQTPSPPSPSLAGTTVSSLSLSRAQSRFPSRAPSSLGLDNILKNFASEFKMSTVKDVNKSAVVADSQSTAAVVLDAVEIWDVRRSWVPKWSVTGTSVEGGVTDLEFADPHVLLTQNMNGTFTQVDMRDVTKPLDAMSRTSTTWTPQGALAFVTDNVPSWEIPYDDVHPAIRPNSDSTAVPSHVHNKKLIVIKRIGDRPFRPKTQKLGTFSLIQDQLEAAAFKELACSYVVDGNDRPALCAMNTQVAMAAGKPDIVQIWMLMQTSLTEHVPPTPLTSPVPLVQSPPTRVTSLNNFPRHATTPTSGLVPYTYPQQQSSSTSRSPDISRQRGSPHHFSAKPGYHQHSHHYPHHRSPSASQRPTPVSSNSSSPLHLSSALPPITPRRPSFLHNSQSQPQGQNQDSPSGMSMSARRRSMLLLRRQSVSSPASVALAHTHAHTHSHTHIHPLGGQSYQQSPVDKSVKNAGEGVLSDSSESPGSDDEGGGDTVGALDSSDGEEEITTAQLSGLGSGGGGLGSVPTGTGAIPNNITGIAINTPSPLSRLPEQQHWTEIEEGEEEEEPSTSPSPGSTDTDPDSEEGGDVGEGEDEILTPLQQKNGRPSLSKSRRNSTKRGKQRSRSSTLASLPATAVVAMAAPPRLSSSTRYQSQSSVRTVIPSVVAMAGETSFGQAAPSSDYPTPVEAMGRESGSRSRGRYSTNREEQQQQCEELASMKAAAGKVATKTTARRADIVLAEEKEMVEYCWEVLRGVFEEFILVGDIQMAATMAAIASEELGLSPRRRMRLFDAYIDQLVKYQLYTTAAYFRKHSNIQQIKNMTLLDTTLHTACGRCKKPLIKPFGNLSDMSWKPPTFGHCLGCKVATVTCTICRLPVRNMVFQCSICHHGGHQLCYRRFYLNQPMVDLPPARAGVDQSRGRSSTRTEAGVHEFVNRSSSTVGAGGQTGSDSLVGMMGGELVGHPCAAGCGHFCWAALKQA